jgi:HEAT repeat protein
MAAEIEFDAYLRSLSSHYDKWWQLYTLTDAETKAQQKAEIFPFELMVQTVAKDRSSNPNDPALQDKEKIERFPVLDGIRKYVAEHQQVLLVGRPGSGKSTTLARLLLEEARAGQCIPVLVELRFLSDSIILDRIQAFFQRHDLQLDRTEIEDLLFHQRLLLLMDGLNELPSEAARLDVAKFRQDYPKVSMIFTTRDLSLGGDFGLEKKLEMQPLTEVQMQAFVRSYVPEQAEAMLRQLKDRLREFGQTPLLLWMLCGLFRQTGQIPANLGEVFRAFTQGYEKNLKADVPVESDRRWWPELLQELAFWMMRGVPFGEEAPAVDVEFRVAISKAEARQIFAAFLQNKEAQAEGVAQKYLDDLLRHHLIQPNGEQVEFRHQLIQEYYAAEALLEQLPKLDDTSLKQQYLNFLKWTEPVGLMLTLLQTETHAERVAKLAWDVNAGLGSRLAGKLQPKLQEKAVKLVEALELPDWLKIQYLGTTRSEKAIPGLLKRLEDSDSDVRRSVAEALGEIRSEAAIPELLKLLKDSAFNVRRSAAEALSEIASAAAISELLKLLEGFNSDVCWIAAEVLGKIGPEAAIPGLLKRLEDSASDVRRSVAQVLGKIRSETAIPELLKLLEHSVFYVRSSAAHALGEIGSEVAIPGLLELLGHPDSEVRRSTADALGEIGAEAAIPGLLELLKHPDFVVRRSAAYALCKIGSEVTIPGLLELLEHPDSEVCRSAAYTLCRIESEVAIPGLLELLEHPDSEMCRSAAYALGEIGAEAAIPGLLELLKHPDSNVNYPYSDVCLSAAKALGKIGSESAIPGLLKLLENSVFYVRSRAAYALGEIGSESAIPGLLKLLEDSGSQNLSSAATALGKIGSEVAIPGLLKLLENSDSYVCSRAADALGEIGSESAIPGLLKLLEHSGSEVRLSAAEALGKIGSESAIPVLLKLLENSDSYVCSRAAEALGKIGPESAIPVLLKLLENYAADVRLSAATALGEIGSEVAIPGLLELLEHPDSEVPSGAADALGKIAKKNTDMIVPHLPHLLTLIPTDSDKRAYQVILAIQENCKFYNYELTQTTQFMKLFFSYAHKDEPLRDELAKHLSLLKRQNIIIDWHDRNITAGTDWAQAIDHNLNTANIILLLISADFLASDYCYDKEMTRALEHHNQSTARVIPIILRPCDWHSAPFGKLQALPKDAKPVTQWSDQDEAFTHIAQGIRKAVAELQQRKTSPATPQSKAASSQPANVTMNFYGTVHGAAGNVQGDQTIQP